MPRFAHEDAHVRFEFPDPTPVEMPVRLQARGSSFEELREYVEGVISRRLRETGQAETFEEADDFEVDDDPDPLSAYEVAEMLPETHPVPPAPPEKPAEGEPPVADAPEAAEGAPASPAAGS